jgi:hypothetical protein
MARERAFGQGFRDDRGYKASTLCWAPSQLRRATDWRAPTGPGAVEVPSRGRAERRTPSSGKTTRFLPVRTRAVGPAVAEIVIEIGAARVRVLRGFDAFASECQKHSRRRRRREWSADLHDEPAVEMREPGTDAARPPGDMSEGRALDDKAIDERTSASGATFTEPAH